MSDFFPILRISRIAPRKLIYETTLVKQANTG